MFKDTPEGTTHSYNDGCGIPEHNVKKIVSTKSILMNEPQQISGTSACKAEREIPRELNRYTFLLDRLVLQIDSLTKKLKPILNDRNDRDVQVSNKLSATKKLSELAQTLEDYNTRLNSICNDIEILQERVEL